MDRISTNGSMIDQLQLPNQPHSGFDMSFHNFLSGRLGAIIPTAVKEVLPGDRIKGNDLIVSQFEPLVAPVMGNMIQKNETFFVPYSVIWDKAHRFFTGKKGFDQEMPQMSFSDMYNVLSGNDLLITFDDCFSRDESHSYFHPAVILASVGVFKNSDWYLNAGLTDLFKPLLAIYDEFYKATNAIKEDGEDYVIISGSLEKQALIAGFMSRIIGFWFGPSSMCDYLGAGCLRTESLLKLFVSNYVTSDSSIDGAINDWFADYHSITVNWMPFRAAYWVWYWNYRDQLIETDVIDPEEEMFSSSISDPEVIACLLLRQRCWMKDTFTTALTNTGDGNIIVPETLQPVEVKYATDVDLQNTSDESAARAAGALTATLKIGDVTYKLPSNYLNGGDTTTGADSKYGISLQMLDRARRLSSWISKRLVLGTEYDDVVYSSFMVKLSNVRMRIPELLSASRVTVVVTPIVNNTDVPDGQPAGARSAIAYANNADQTGHINYFAEEHGLLLSFLSVLPIQSYPNQVQRLYFKKNRFDFAWPEFAQLGYDAIYLSELNGAISLNSESALTVFGYQGRYYDYKCNQDEEHGRLHTDLNFLTFGRAWNADELPKLNPEFVHCWPRTDMFVVDDGVSDLFRSDVYHRWAMERVLPVPSDVLR